MERFPKSLISFQRMFPDEAACAAWLFSMRWPEGFQCPGCGHDHGWALRAKAHYLANAPAAIARPRLDRGDDPPRQQARSDGLVLGGLSDGDPFERHLRPSAAEAARSRVLSHAPGCWPPNCAGRWSIQTAIRCRGWSRSTKPPCLSGPRTTPRPAAPGEAMTASCSWSVASRWATATSRADCAWPLSPDYGAGSLNAFIARNIAPASTAKTDGWAGYAGVPVNQHDPHVIGAMAAHLVLPWIHQMFSNLKGWARGVYHGLRRKYLQTYLDEFVFRFNRRRTRHATFRSLFAIAIRAKPATYFTSILDSTTLEQSFFHCTENQS